jgi:hypothetical protein
MASRPIVKPSVLPFLSRGVIPPQAQDRWGSHFPPPLPESILDPRRETSQCLVNATCFLFFWPETCIHIYKVEQRHDANAANPALHAR